ncbi:AI-2E family transporter [Candidatus Pacearchaeota archaeon]|nr:MAG: AI-2E family transporter [Candidatus Pacearchaeota archaeon]
MRKLKETFFSRRGLYLREIKKYSILLTFFFLLVVSFYIVKSYLTALLSAFIFAYLVFPIHKRMRKTLGNSFSALISVALVLGVIFIPSLLVFGGIAQQIISYFSTNGSQLLETLESSKLVGKLGIQLNSLDNISTYLISLFSSALKFVPSMLVFLLITIFSMYYFILDWDKLSAKLRTYLPFVNKEKVARDISEVTRSIVYGTFLVAVIEFVIAALGFYLLGVNFFLLLAALVFLLAFVPLGPAVVWVPAVALYLLRADYFTAIGVLVLGLVLSFGIDTIARAKLVGNKTNINPVVMLLGIFGGVPLFGLFGFVIGPLILAYTLKIMEEVFSPV